MSSLYAIIAVLHVGSVMRPWPSTLKSSPTLTSKAATLKPLSG